MLQRKKLWLFLLVIGLLLGSFSGWGTASSEETIATDEPQITAQAAILIEASTGRVIWSKDADVRHYPASMTKMMTGILALEELTPRQEVIISPNAAGTEDCPLEIMAGERLPANEIITGMLLESDNGAAVAIAEAVDGTVEKFAQRMNDKAKELDMTSTHFVNPNGLTAEGHYSTARDMAKLARYALENQRFRQIVGTKQQVIHWDLPLHKQYLAENTNKLLNVYEGMNGTKTGWTKAAGGCLAASAKRNGVELIAIVMQTPTPDDRFLDAAKVLDYGFKNVKMVKGISKERVTRKVWLKNSKQASTLLHPASDVNYPLLHNEDASHYSLEYDVPKVISAPLKSGEKVGRLIIKYNGKAVGSVDMVADKVETGSSVGSWLVSLFEGLLNRM